MNCRQVGRVKGSPDGDKTIVEGVGTLERLFAVTGGGVPHGIRPDLACDGRLPRAGRVTVDQAPLTVGEASRLRATVTVFANDIAEYAKGHRGGGPQARSVEAGGRLSLPLPPRGEAKKAGAAQEQ